MDSCLIDLDSLKLTFFIHLFESYLIHDPQTTTVQGWILHAAKEHRMLF